MNTILLVDDDQGVCKCLGDMLSRSGYDVVAAQSGAAALAAIGEREAVDLVIADYRMPGMDGLTLARRLREARPDLPIVIMTGRGDLESYLCATGLGVVSYITKPVGLRRLRQIVGDALAGDIRADGPDEPRVGHP